MLSCELVRCGSQNALLELARSMARLRLVLVVCRGSIPRIMYWSGGVRPIGLVISRNDKHNLTLTSRTILLLHPKVESK
jgi:hypothetical protein